MDERFSSEALVEVVHRYYPAGIHGDEPLYRLTEEYKRWDAARRAAQENNGAWECFLQQVREQFPRVTLWELPGLLYDPSNRVRIYLPGSSKSKRGALVVIASILAPVHVLYASKQRDLGEGKSESQHWFPPLPSEFQEYEAKLDALIHASLGSTRLPNDVLFTPVPDVQVGNTSFGEVNLLHCLFTDDIW
jgi:hypothetical protein